MRVDEEKINDSELLSLARLSVFISPFYQCVNDVSLTYELQQVVGSSNKRREYKTNRRKIKEMPHRLNTSMTLILVTVLVTAVVQSVDGYPHERPDVTRKSERVSRSLESSNRNGPVPSCRNLTYCTETPYYPSDYVDSLLSMNESLKYLATIDVPSTISHRIDEDDEKALCTSKEDVVRPKTALSIDDRWLYIVNSDNYMQRVRVEICQSRNTACGMIDGFAEGYKTTCRQTYIYRQLVAIGSGGTIMPELFKIPASCKCYIKFTGDPWMRIGVNLNKSNKQSAVLERPTN